MCLAEPYLDFFIGVGADLLDGGAFLTGFGGVGFSPSKVTSSGSSVVTFMGGPSDSGLAMRGVFLEGSSVFVSRVVVLSAPATMPVGSASF
jgi:hypothetical protein